MVQLREKDLTASELWPIAQQLRSLTHRYSAKLFINDRIDLALACAADGIHLGEHSVPISVARQLLGSNRLIGVSTHTLSDVSLATRQGADFLTFGPVFHTPSKEAYGPPQGLDQLQHACRQTRLPILALGGIKTEHVSTVLSHGASGIALISGIISNNNPQKATQELVSKLS